MSAMVTTASVLDVLYGLLEAEEGSVFRFMRQGNPYLTRATVEMRGRVEMFRPFHVQKMMVGSANAKR